MRRSAPLPLTLIAAAVLLFATACGGSDDGGTGSSATVPDTQHIEVATGETVSLTELSGDTPTLAWFWAPH